ncbi:MAG: class I SAM-dependent methyltransferase [Candidatus Aureabacteria bacterium]|nr:class I SAM-dependent methyltransferase [Candidatus Auribacterota bacterium]
MQNETDLKTRVKEFWNDKSCGEVYASGESERNYYESQARARYNLEPYLHDFAGFHEGKGKDVLEIGVGMGADHLEWAKSGPRTLTGVDITTRAIEHTQKRLALYGLKSELRVDDAENLSFDDASFDLVYSWGVLHHTPNTPETVNQVFRVLRHKGIARIMIYHKYALTGYMLWARYGLLTGRPFQSLTEIYANHLESPGTKAYSIQEAEKMFAKFSQVSIRSQLSFGDLLQGSVGQKHHSMLLSWAKKLWPRWLIRKILKNHGLFLLIEAIK